MTNDNNFFDYDSGDGNFAFKIRRDPQPSQQEQQPPAAGLLEASSATTAAADYDDSEEMIARALDDKIQVVAAAVATQEQQQPEQPQPQEQQIQPQEQQPRPQQTAAPLAPSSSSTLLEFPLPQEIRAKQPDLGAVIVDAKNEILSLRDNNNQSQLMVKLTGEKYGDALNLIKIACDRRVFMDGISDLAVFLQESLFEKKEMTGSYV